ncbi:uncharacterized protein LOC118189704 [Stegodyphus dumicola]|uniref:uncharacterized protein LOC118189704 n=1 Tax=Stegodyphus dumicola TaxID=202533 RepID=UPI0015AEE334|nr:uncharacterized protein LOC118189704 [Stegodyphus dumicola]
MAREKIFDSVFQKAFTEAINKEDKLRKQWYLEEENVFPHIERVSIDTSDSDSESSTSMPEAPETNICKNCVSYPPESEKKKIKEGKESFLVEKCQHDCVNYIFPICNYCDFGWKYGSSKDVVCPKHGPYKRYIFPYHFPTEPVTKSHSKIYSERSLTE